jgi:HAD superfamily hydrolase (TIGR01509 family)
MPTRHLPAAAIFDWDGTLVDTMAMIYRANVASLRHYGLTMSREWFREQYTPDWRRGYQELGIPEHLWDEMAGRWAAEMARMRPRAMPWARGALRDLRRHGVMVGLVTASTRGVVEPNIERLNLEGVFQTAWYSDDVERSKPHPEALYRALDDLDVTAADTVYVGDTLVDLEMTVAAGASFVAVGTTMSPEAFHDAGVERVWPGVGAWADDLLGRPSRRPGAVPTTLGSHGSPTGPSGTPGVTPPPVRSRP